MPNKDQKRDAAVEVRFSRDEAADLDAWIAEYGDGLTRPDAIKVLIRRAIEIDRDWTRAKRDVIRDEGLRPQELTSENDG
jgi:3-oxoacyl-ACP reductase-like protein